jgi:phosphonate transport system ATP-binding protein
MSVLEINNLTKYYKDVLALSGIKLKIRKGEFISIIGPSGAGKSTLLRCINRLIEASEGEILIDDIDICKLKRRELRRMRTKIGMIFQHYNLVNRLTVIENVLHGRLGYKSNISGIIGNYSEKEKKHALEIIDELGLSDQVYKRCDNLSGGQKQRVGIARALVQDPYMILCDEPIASLDPGSAKIIMDHLKKISHEKKITVLVNLHQVDVALKYSERIIGINSGKILYDGSPKKITKKEIYAIYGSESGELILD